MRGRILFTVFLLFACGSESDSGDSNGLSGGVGPGGAGAGGAGTMPAAAGQGGESAQEPPSQPECFPLTPRCEDGAVTYRPAHVCAEPTFECALGCRDGEEHVNNSIFSYPYYCEETAVRSEGFPCRADIDCVTPDRATEFFTDTPAVDPNEPSGTLRCDTEELKCVSGDPVPEDGTATCSGKQSPEEHDSVTFDADCASGACVVPAGERQGTCSSTCSEDDDCPDGSACELVLDQRYQEWSKLIPGIIDDYMPRLRACVPE